MFEKILLAVDGSDHSQKAVPVAIDIAQRRKAEVTVFHAVERTHPRGPVGAIETPQEAQDLVAKVAEELKKAGVPVRIKIVSAAVGYPAKEIVDTAKEDGDSLIILGSRGLTDLSGLVLGSVTHKVLHLAHTPVLVVR